jgi:Matrixin
MRRLAAIGMLVGALAVPATVQAVPADVPGGVVPFDREAEIAYQVAVNYLGQPAGCPTVERYLAPIVLLEGQVKEGVADGCSITMQEGLPFIRFCEMTAHELGHLHGLGHSSDPNDVMYPDGPLNFVPGCVAAATYLSFEGLAASVRKRCRAPRRHRARDCWDIARGYQGEADRFKPSPSQG